jgi:hypothetical protein
MRPSVEYLYGPFCALEEILAAEPETPVGLPARVKSYSRSLFGDFLKSINSWISKTLFAAFSALMVVLFTPINEKYIQPIRFKIESYFFDQKEITREDALRLAKRFVGKSATVAIPFHNKGDPNQYVAVWSDQAGSICATYDEDEAKCPYGNGPLTVDLLVGNGDAFERVNTRIPALPNQVTAEYALSNPALFTANAGVSDWNSDGFMEIFSIADQSAMTAPQRVDFVSVYDTKDRSIVQLKVKTPPGTSEFVGSSDPKLRAWLSGRHLESQSNVQDDCDRERAGTLSCVQPAANNEDAEGMAEFEFLDGLTKDWNSNNGADFTTGLMKVQFSPMKLDVRNSQNLCEVDDGEYTLASLFKGPLLIWRKDGSQIAVLYEQDAAHHREVPAIIVGKTRYWLGLAVGQKIIAIDKTSFESTAYAIKEWQKIFGDKERYPDYETLATEGKDFQIENLSAEGGVLNIDGIALTLTDEGGNRFDKSEFTNAAWCNIWQEPV